ncbi:hypothetical protein BaRGS_00015117 [Batillaria attramentaria]|uniref:Uncharacterized protein n=1 Tax=Batillaria attramentaria TaxID=370345 RepID=A0ABD0L2Q0_9CAEN
MGWSEEGRVEMPNGLRLKGGGGICDVLKGSGGWALCYTRVQPGGQCSRNVPNALCFPNGQSGQTDNERNPVEASGIYMFQRIRIESFRCSIERLQCRHGTDVISSTGRAHKARTFVVLEAAKPKYKKITRYSLGVVDAELCPTIYDVGAQGTTPCSDND